MNQPESPPRRVAWTGTGPGVRGSAREKIIAAAVDCIVTHGADRTSISAVARRAGVSRQTIYMHFATREEIVAEALRLSATTASERILAQARTADTAADFVVELCLAALEEFRANPAIAPISALLAEPSARRATLADDVLEEASRFLEPLVEYQPELRPRLGEITETYLRFELSLLTLDSARSTDTGQLRDYLRRTLVPALGITPSA